MNTAPASPQTVLITGAYGLIGSGVARRLIADGHRVKGLGRDKATAKRVLPDLPWIIRDMRNLTEASVWTPLLDGVTVVINCSGALQDGPQDDLEAIHSHAVSALATACTATDIQLIQISAVGAIREAPTAFMASKARGDDAIRRSGAMYQIFRPGLVLAPHSYGGTTLLRMLAAVPRVQPLAIPDAQMQTVALGDVARVVSAAVAGTFPSGFEADLVEEHAHSLRNIVAAIRHWLGFKPAHHEWIAPAALTTLTSKIADALSTLGWRSPLRSTAFRVLSDGVTGQPADLAAHGLAPLSSLPETLAAMPARVEDRLFARMALLTPLIIATLSLFWLVSGLIGLLRLDQAAGYLQNAGWPAALAIGSVIFWSLVDIAIGLAFAIRKYARRACWAAIIVSLIYLISTTLVVPGLWLHPLGPMVKVIPGILLALVARVALDTR